MNKIITIVLVLVLAVLSWFFFLRDDKEVVVVPSPSPSAGPTQKVLLYYYNPQKDMDTSGNIMCSRSGLEAVERSIALSDQQPIEAVKMLLKGDLTAEERARGITTEYPLAGLELINGTLENGTLTLQFNDPMNRTGGGSCRVGILWFQIDATARQFPTVTDVRFLPEELFQP